ncbi:uncharacterized protein IL334_002226 [Kwoniella shivajii]|uniref:Xylanolytic transcriptional activator regulatory domain-containing protein n=1 Tax=Kwoniella shivajii TaxID=564305 RepID=A0ABZ1CU94_9TREE|nr:hypothetical protein IL334_002226 [Kwoniella shivajii]
MRLLAACNSNLGADPLPHALLCGILGHSLVYEPLVKSQFRDVWREVVAAEEEEYKQPRLRTLQLAILSLATRPSQAHAVNAMSLARSVSIAHMIGLHLDCSEWRLPRWERSVRKRVWWALVILDKWIAMVHGRPSLIHKHNRSVPLPTLDDTDWGEFSSSLQVDEDTLIEHSMASFIGQSELALIVEDMLDRFYSQESQRRNSTAAGDDLRELSAKLDALQARLPDCLRSANGVLVDRPPATGILSRLLSINVSRQAQAIEVGLELCGEFVVFLENLNPGEEYDSFWLPLRVHRQINSLVCRPSLTENLAKWSSTSLALVRRLVKTLNQAKDIHKWELAESAMIRGNELLRTASTLLPDLTDLVNAPIEVSSNQTFNFDFPDFGALTDSFGSDWSWALNLGEMKASGS